MRLTVQERIIWEEFLGWLKEGVCMKEEICGLERDFMEFKKDKMIII